MPMPAGQFQKVQIVEVLKNYPISTKANGQGAADQIELNLDIAELWGPYLLSIIGHTRMVGRSSANIFWTVALYTSFDGLNWTIFTTTNGQIFAGVNTNADAVQAAFTQAGNPTAFALHMKFVLSVWTAAGTAESATIGLALEFDFKS